ncbi:purine permease 4 [Perilla frutescens var. frutescens]|nr:purine permease 4 [Perilla frutescens var. frutescens]
MELKTNSSPTNHHHQQQNSSKSSKNFSDLTVVINYACLIIGSVAASLLTKFYFIHNGSSRWVSTWIQTAGFPLLLLPTFLPYHLLRSTPRPPFSGFTTRLTLQSIFVGMFLAVSNYLFSWGTSYLPVSTSSLLLSSQLAFNLVFSIAMVKQKVTFTNLNCVILLTLSSVLLALSSSGDRPPGLTRRDYLIGFFATLGAGLTFAVYLPVMQMIYRRVYCYAMVVEMQLVTGLVATALATVGMAAGGGFADMRAESAAGFDEGTAAYWWTIGGTAVAWQMSFMGTAGMVFLTTSLTGGICMTALMPVNVVAGVVVYGDKFGGVKAVSAVICVWGFCSHLFGMYVKSKKLEDRRRNPSGDIDMNEIVVHS